MNFVYRQPFIFIFQNKSDVHNAEQLIAKTVVSFPKDGPIHAVATLETYPGVKKSVSSPSYHVNVKPSAPPMPPTTASGKRIIYSFTKNYLLTIHKL